MPTLNELKLAYKNSVLMWHPDKNPHNEAKANEMFRLIKGAYQRLMTSPQYASGVLSAGEPARSSFSAQYDPWATPVVAQQTREPREPQSGNPGSNTG